MVKMKCVRLSVFIMPKLYGKWNFQILMILCIIKVKI
jgi:hypothetical protein